MTKNFKRVTDLAAVESVDAKMGRPGTSKEGGGGGGQVTRYH